MVKSAWDAARDTELARLHSSGKSVREIAARLGVHSSSVSRRVKALGLADTPAAPPIRGSHLQNFKSAQRGFDVPPHLEGQYVELLKTGIPIAEACRRLGINKTSNEKG